MDKREELQRELDSLRAEHRRVLESGSYRLGRLLVDAVRSPRSFLRFPLDVSRLVRDLRRRRRPPGPGAKSFEVVRDGWQQLAEQVREGSVRDVVFMFSGTTFIQGTRGNRPIRLTQALLARGVPVLFSYHRARFDEPLPDPQTSGLVQSPVDITMQLLDEVAGADVGDARKLFVVSYPYPGIERYVQTFRRHGWRVVYDCRDDWKEFSRVGMARWFDPSVERSLVAGCERTFCVSRPLVEKMRRLAPGSRVELMPNAVESDFLPKGYEPDPELSPRVVGYFGHLASAWFDWPAFAEIARRSPQYRFEIIGHSAPDGLDLPSNVALLGPKPWHQLHRYASRWSAAIIPFRMGPLADGVDPIKIYEYLSFGLPVVSFLMPQIADYPATETVDSVDAFCAALERACESEVDQGAIDRFLSRNTWEVRADRLLAVLEESAP
jgi:glycosyltransferase involved in cell wall biosynthesis